MSTPSASSTSTTRNFCPSCQAKRAALFGEFLVELVLLSVPHRHIVFTIPKSLRRLFERDRRLLGILARSAHDATRGYFRQALGMKQALRILAHRKAKQVKSPFAARAPPAG